MVLCVHPITFQGCCSRLLGFGTVKMKQGLCSTICQAAEAKDSWSNMFAFPSGGSIKTNGAGEVGGPAQGGTECFCSCPNISASLLTLLKTNVWIFLPLPDTGKSSSFPPRQKEKHKAKPFSNYFLM